LRRAAKRIKKAAIAVKTQRLVFFWLEAEIGVFVPFSAAYGLCQAAYAVNRALKAARVPCALFAALDIGETPPPPAILSLSYPDLTHVGYIT
jgi:hypothetical protein